MLGIQFPSLWIFYWTFAEDSQRLFLRSCGQQKEYNSLRVVLCQAQMSISILWKMRLCTFKSQGRWRSSEAQAPLKIPEKLPVTSQSRTVCKWPRVLAQVIPAVDNLPQGWGRYIPVNWLLPPWLLGDIGILTCLPGCGFNEILVLS